MSEEKYRLVTRSDFDGLVCAVLLNELNLIDEITFVHPLPTGHVDPRDIAAAIRPNTALVSVMHANNETGTVTPIDAVGELCRKYQAVFHCDTVQTMGHLVHDLSATPVDFVTCAAHKFHGPKGVGFLYINKRIKKAF